MQIVGPGAQWPWRCRVTREEIAYESILLETRAGASVQQAECGPDPRQSRNVPLRPLRDPAPRHARGAPGGEVRRRARDRPAKAPPWSGMPRYLHYQPTGAAASAAPSLRRRTTSTTNSQDNSQAHDNSVAVAHLHEAPPPPSAPNVQGATSGRPERAGLSRGSPAPQNAPHPAPPGGQEAPSRASRPRPTSTEWQVTLSLHSNVEKPERLYPHGHLLYITEFPPIQA